MSTSSFIYAEKGKDVSLSREELRKNIWDQYKELDEFRRHFQEDPNDAKAMIENIVDTYLKSIERKKAITPDGGNGSISLIYYTKFKQKNSYYCGPASALTAIYGMGKEDDIVGNTYNEKQDILAKNMDTDSSSGTYVYKMRNELNKYSTEEYNYFYAPTKDDMFGIIVGSLLSDNAPILHANTKAFSYYNGHETGHYVTIVFHNSQFDDDEIGGIAVMDNNRNDSYYGSRDISLDEAYKTIRGRYLIGVDL